MPKDYLKKYLNIFFGVRNGVYAAPQEKVNFTVETLTYMTPRKLANKITNLVVQRTTSPRVVIDATAGIGGNALSFLDSDDIAEVILYEKDPDRRRMLQNNLDLYGCRGSIEKAVIARPPSPTRRRKYTLIDSDQGFTLPPAGFTGTLFIDPPWLPESKTGEDCTEEDYLSADIKLGDYTLEEILDRSRSCSLILIKVPPNYVLKYVTNYHINYLRLKKMVIVIASSTKGVPAL